MNSTCDDFTNRKPCPNVTGGRISSSWQRRLDDMADQFQGLPAGVGRYDLLRLLNRVGRKLGFTNTLINHLQYLINHTRDEDWQAGGRPIVYKTIIAQAQDLGITDRQIANRERALHDLGALTWTDSGNHRRMGYRDGDGRIVNAYGVNLAPLAYLYPVLVDMDIVLDRLRRHWTSLKQSVSSLRRRILALAGELAVSEVANGRLASICSLPEMVSRIRASVSIERLGEIRQCLSNLLDELKVMIIGPADETPKPVENPSGTKKTSARAEINFCHKYNTNNQISLSEKCKDVLRTAVDQFATARVDRQQAIQGNQRLTTGIEYIRLGAAVAAASDGFKAWLKKDECQIGWPDLIVAAQYRAQELGIVSHAWHEACRVMGREAAAIAILIIDQKMKDVANPVRSPGAVLYGMARKAKIGELALHRSLFGVLSHP